jgi:hypothetical protein
VLAAVRFISAEPLLGPPEGLDLRDIDWLIVGGESEPRHRRVDTGWVTDRRDRCHEFNDDLLPWGSPKVMSAWIEMVRTRDRGLASDTEATEFQGDLIRANGTIPVRAIGCWTITASFTTSDDHFDLGLVSEQAATANRSASEAVYWSRKTS